MSDTPRTDALIASADACPETRILFLIKSLANLAKDLEREIACLKKPICEWQEGFDCGDSICIEDRKCQHPKTGPLYSERVS